MKRILFESFKRWEIMIDITGSIGVLNQAHNDLRMLVTRVEYQKKKRMEVKKILFFTLHDTLAHNNDKLLLF